LRLFHKKRAGQERNDRTGPTNPRTLGESLKFRFVVGAESSAPCQFCTVISLFPDSFRSESSDYAVRAIVVEPQPGKRNAEGAEFIRLAQRTVSCLFQRSTEFVKLANELANAETDETAQIEKSLAIVFLAEPATSYRPYQSLYLTSIQCRSLVSGRSNPEGVSDIIRVFFPSLLLSPN